MASKRVAPEVLHQLATDLRLYGLLAHWDKVRAQPWLPSLLEMEREERDRRGHEYRLRNAKIGKLKHRADFDWRHPTRIDRAQVEDLFTLAFVPEGVNVVLVGPNGVGKTMLAKNLAYEAVSRGVSTRYVTASDMLASLGGLQGTLLTQRLKRYVAPQLLVIDELAYLRYDEHLADLLYEVLSRRYEAQASVVVTTNKPFSEWNQVIAGAACVATMVDRLCHRVEIVQIEGASYRVTEAKARSKARRATRAKPRK